MLVLRVDLSGCFTFTLTGGSVEGEPCITETEEASRIVLTALAARIAAALVDVWNHNITHVQT